jgi:hypothetical protein
MSLISKSARVLASHSSHIPLREPLLWHPVPRRAFFLGRPLVEAVFDIEVGLGRLWS